MTAYLLDANVLIAFTTSEHMHHDRVWHWFEPEEPDIASCPITEGALVRHQMRSGSPAEEAAGHLDLLRANPWHRFWPDDLAYSSRMLDGIIGHRQVTDAYLVALAAHHGGTLVTLDRGLAAFHPAALLLDT